MDLCRLNKDQAYRLLKKLIDAGKIVKEGEKRTTIYKRSA
jgi:hypothetical protein